MCLAVWQDILVILNESKFKGSAKLKEKALKEQEVNA
jgi:hypothetical protein